VSQVNDIELKKAALVIAKLLLRTREGRIQWRNDNATRRAASDFFDAYSGKQTSGSFLHMYTADLEDGVQAALSRDENRVEFRLSGPPAMDIPSQPLAGVAGVGLSSPSNNEILSVSLDHSYGKSLQLSPESLIYRDLDELIRLAENPKSVSDDIRLRQVMSYLDKLAV
jgi:hypothetical protein